MHEIVSKNLIHGPCGSYNPRCVCMENGRCKKNFPKDFCDETVNPEDSYPVYMRRSPEKGGHTSTLTSNMCTIDNRWVVPYNPYLTKRFNAHINVEICNTVQVLKYLFKYVYKGHDKISASLSANDFNPNEITRYLEGRYVCPNEAFWRIFGFDMHSKSPAVEILSVHLKDGQTIIFADGDGEDAIVNGPPKTTLTGYFERVLYERANPLLERERGFTEDGSMNPTALDLTYSEFVSFYTWVKKERKWVRRKTHFNTISRIYTMKANTELFYLRMLLYHRKNIGSFSEMQSVDNVLKESYKDVCICLGLLADDDEWIFLFDEAINYYSAKQLRNLYATVLVFNEVKNPLHLFEKYKQSFAEDQKYRRSLELFNRNINFIESDYSECLWLISDVIHEITNGRKSLADFNIPLPTIPRLNQIPDNPDLHQELSYDVIEQEQVACSNVQKMNFDQRNCYDKIMNAINFVHIENATEDNVQRIFFIDAPGGTGKTFTFNTILAAVRGSGKVAIAVASSAIASQLLVGGTTAHRRFGIPIELKATSLCSFSNNSKAVILQSAVIIWDEAPMLNMWGFEAVDRSLRLLTKIEKPFGGKIVVLGGDFRQVLPVIPKANKTQIMSMILKRSDLWCQIKKLSLTINERVKRGENTINILEFSEFLLEVGEGRVPIESDISPNTIAIPENYLYTSENIKNFINWCYPSEDSINYERNDVAILAPKNEDVDKINDVALESFPGDIFHLYSADTIKVQDSSIEITNFPEEFLNSLNPNGFPLHHLILKINCPVILLRNLNVKDGLCNGTRLTVTKISIRLLTCRFSTGPQKGKEVLIPRISLDSNGNAYPFTMTRRQFPVRLAFSMTINKAQGQTLSKVAIFLNDPVFGHGQLYVALSRSGNPNCTKILIRNVKNKQGKFPGKTGQYTDNIVYTEAIDLM